ncbi:MAG TPA: pitrilysin family protein [Anaerolineales bacterium]|nr:pitrilysin family protein [Anaerolineales bacterium]
METEIKKLQLSNGLQVLLKEIHTAPIISVWLWYRVGSRNERPGITGISHWTEHMQFKGTARFPADVLDKAVAREGGYRNAFTFLDWTTYFETMPADKVDLALDLEADRMHNSTFTPSDVESERTVIISERQGNENEPLFLLGEEVQAAAFRVHSYHHEIIGDMADLQSIQRDDLYYHYRAHYVPGNATLAVAGDFESESMLTRIRALFDPLPDGRATPQRTRTEPRQPGERRLAVEGPGETTYVQAAYHAPAATDPDFFPYLVTDSMLTGPSNQNLFGGGISNKTSRLYRALVEKELAVSVSGGLTATIDPFLHNVMVTVHPNSMADQVIGAMDDEIKHLQDTPPPDSEVTRAVKQARALFAYGSESITNQAYWMGYSEMFATYEWFLNYLDRLAAVTPEDVQRIARTYLRPGNRVLGVYLPTGHTVEGD